MWIESHQSLRNHPKIKKAARLAGINEYEMIGRLHCLWWWALDYAPDGDVTKYSADDIESAVDWEGIQGAFYSALLQCGFNGHCGLLERIDDVTVIIHDWHEYGGRLLEKREANAERMRAKRAMHVQDTTVARTGATEQNSTEQNNTNKKAPKATPPQVSAYREVAHRYPNKSLYDDIVNAVPESEIEFYKQVLKAWIGLGWNPSNIQGQLESFKRREIPHKNGQPAQPKQIDPSKVDWLT